MATSGMIKGRAQRPGMGRKFALSRLNTCTCHPCQWGLKKGLRRARRRLDKDIVVLNIRENDDGPVEIDTPGGDRA